MNGTPVCNAATPLFAAVFGFGLLPADRPEVKGDEIRGHIARTDSFGNLISNIDASLIPEAVRSRVAIEFGMQRIDGISRFYSEKQPGEPSLPMS